MTRPRIDRRVVRGRKKSAVPLAKLRTSDAVRTVVDHPRRLQELLRMLEDKDRGVRGRSAAALARLSESHPSRLLRAILQLRVGLMDESAYVRWHLVYAFGKIGAFFPVQSREYLYDLVLKLEDENRVVRSLASKALLQVAARKPSIVEEFFQALKKEMPADMARAIHHFKAHWPE